MVAGAFRDVIRSVIIMIRVVLSPCRRTTNRMRHLAVLFVLSTIAMTFSVFYLIESSSYDATISTSSRSKFRFRSRSEWQHTNNGTFNRDRDTLLDDLQRIVMERRQIAQQPVKYSTGDLEEHGANDDGVVGRERWNSRGQLLLTTSGPSEQVNLSPVESVVKLVHKDESLMPTRARRNRIGQLRGGPGRCKVYDVRRVVSEISGADFPASECVPLDADVIMRYNSTVSSSLLVCPYPDIDDLHLSKPLRVHHVWEPHIVTVFLAAIDWVASAAGQLREDHDSASSAAAAIGVYDIGANVGQYSLLAAGIFGCRVVAVEPYRPNIIRLHKAVELNRLPKQLTVVENAVSNERDTFELSVSDKNPSAIRLTSQDADRFCTEPGCPAHATTIFLDDLLEVTNFDVAVMKIDVEGYEHRSFVHSDQLFTEVKVAYIFMEWTKMRDHYGSEADSVSDNKRLVQQLIDRLVDERGYVAYGLNDLQRLEPPYWYGWPNDIVWVHREAIPPRQLLGDVTKL